MQSYFRRRIEDRERKYDPTEQREPSGRQISALFFYNIYSQITLNHSFSSDTTNKSWAKTCRFSGDLNVVKIFF
jgi:hypothetical protein